MFVGDASCWHKKAKHADTLRSWDLWLS